MSCFSYWYRYFGYIVLYVLTGISGLNAQVLDDSATLDLVKKTVNQIYSMRFREAGETADIISRKFPEHPVVYLLRGMIIYWENYPLISGSKAGAGFENQMKMCIEKTEDPTDESEAEYLLASLCARGSLLAYYIGNNLQSKVMSLGRTSYRYVRRSFDFTGSFPDFYFFTGLYNYYREAYPDAHPVYKPVFAVFPRGDRRKGLIELQTAFIESIFLKAEAATFLSSNYKYFEKDFANASSFSSTIFKAYPGNTVYLINCIEDLLLTGKYDRAEKLIISSGSVTQNRYYQAQFLILRGILNEKKYGDMKRAEQEYSEGAEKISEFANYGNQYAAYAWFGLSRISASRDDRHNERVFRRKAVDMTDFPEVSFDE